MNATTSTSSVRKALFSAQRDVGGIGKDSTAKVTGKGKDGGAVSYSYAFVSTEDMLAHCRQALHAHGLSWEMVGYEIVGSFARTDGRSAEPPMLHGSFELVHAESGEILERRYSMPIASRNDADKALSGAITYLLGQATRLLLLVPKVSDEDAKNEPDRRETPADDHPRSERKVTPAAALRLPPAERHYTDEELARLRKECQQLAPIASAALDLRADEMRREAGMPAGQLSGGQLARYRKWMIESIDIKGGVVPDWALSWDPFDQRLPAALDGGAS